MKKRVWLGLCAAFGLGVGTTAADVWYVATNGSDSLPREGKTWEDAYGTISNALAKAASAGYDHQVWVSNGAYALTSQLYLTKGVRLRGAYGAGQTILDGGDATRCVFITNGVLDGFTVSNGYADATVSYGGGVYIVTGDVLNCIVTGNRSQRSGGGIYGASGGLGTVSNCIIAGNRVTNVYTSGHGGGGAYFLGSGWQVLDCPSIADNVAYQYAGGVYMSGASLVSNCTFSNNLAFVASGSPFGGGIYAYDRAQVIGCLVASNIADNAGNGYGGGIYIGNTGLVVNCTVRENAVGERGGGIYVTYGGIVKNCPEISYNRTANGVKRGGGIALNDGTVVDCTILANSAGRGGGLSSTTYGTVSNCVISENHANDEGGGVEGNGAELVVRNCLITKNRSVRAAGVMMWDNTANPGTVKLENCTVVSNRATTGTGGVHCFWTNTVINTLIYSNRNNTGASDLQRDNQGATFTNCCVTNAAVLVGANNIPDYPDFADPANGDWRLKANTPCVNAGTNEPWVEGSVDLDGRTRADVFSRRVDIGAYEYVPAGALIQMR